MGIESLTNPRFKSQSEEVMNIGEVLQRGGEYATDQLNDRLRIIGQPLPKSSDPQAAVRALMIRDCIDLAVRDCDAVRRLLSWTADFIASTTQKTRRTQIIPATPSCIRLKETVLESLKALDGCCAEPWTRDDAGIDEVRIVVGPVKAKDFMFGRSSLLGANAGQVQFEELLYTITRLESHWGSFDIWVRRPRVNTCKSLVRAFQNGEIDSEEFLCWFRASELKLIGNQLDPYLAQVLLGMRVSGGTLVLPGDMTVKRKGREVHLGDLGDCEIYQAIVRAARARKYSYESGTYDQTRAALLDRRRRLEEIDQHFVDSSELEEVTSRGAAFINAATREDWERVGRAAGLNRKQARVLARRAAGTAHQKNDPAAWKAIYRRKDALAAAMIAEVLYGQVGKKIFDAKFN